MPTLGRNSALDQGSLLASIYLFPRLMFRVKFAFARRASVWATCAGSASRSCAMDLPGDLAPRFRDAE